MPTKMEFNENKEETEISSKNSCTQLKKQVTTNQLEWPENISEIELIDQKLSAETLDTAKLPLNLVKLNLSRNKIGYVPSAVHNLNLLKILDLSHNRLEFFDETPSFCHTIERLNLEKNNLHGPPYWVWTEKPKKLEYLNIRHNACLANSLTEDYLAELLAYKVSINNVLIDNCKLGKSQILLSTIEAKKLAVGSRELTYSPVNAISEFPCVGLNKCVNIESLDLSNTQLYSINTNIDIYKDLVEIDLSFNFISSLPSQFCNLKMLRVCILSHNRLMYLPDRFTELRELVYLHLDSNELCLMPVLTDLEKLQYIDLYNNSLSSLPEGIENVAELDLAQNYFEEPIVDEYLEKKQKLRSNDSRFQELIERIDGNKTYVEPSESEYSTNEFSSDDEISSTANSYCDEAPRPPSSVEDWDSEDFWIPYPVRRYHPPVLPWLNFARKRMSEGHFCPMDLHTVPISEQVAYHKMCYPSPVTEVPGQFDDLSSDDS